MATANEILKLSEERASLMYDFEDILRKNISTDAKVLYATIIDDLISKLSVTNGRIDTTAQNIILINTLDSIYANFERKYLSKYVKLILEQYIEIFNLNSNYFNTMMDRNVGTTEAKNIFNSLIGLTKDGNLVDNGYLSNLSKDTSIKTSIRSKVIEGITTNKEVSNLTKELRVDIIGNKEKKGLLESRIAEPAIDNYTNVDGLVQATYADKIGLDDFIYQGTKRRDSRHFCTQRKGKVFSFKEADKFKDLIGKYQGKTPIGPIVGTKDQTIEQKKADYNWKVKPGGWGCVDFISYISPEIAEILRERQS